MAHQLASGASTTTPRFNVLGIIMIDSVAVKRISEFPGLAGLWPTGRVDKSPEEVKAMKLKEKVDLNMTHARAMLQRWDVPRWEGRPVPPTILLRAKDLVDAASGSFVDHSRHERLLGWGPYNDENGKFVRSVVDIDGHHFSIFQEQYVSAFSAGGGIRNRARRLTRDRFPTSPQRSARQQTR